MYTIIGAMWTGSDIYEKETFLCCTMHSVLDPMLRPCLVCMARSEKTGYHTACRL